ncbi:reverse transcriptase domain-containing protein [Crocosphaera sp.]|uniref:reverse transcriptase domain-containing protein n=1 Tax=Crocosphaera sp. TaxID=2729996 RepID=UPI002602A06A|nr:reverse transcriptase domain-containing protein [Crocosphaera sp.]MDJ0578680.1 reverse transcriptase domain-containing protein [Crocosphaera sp.]
MSKAQEAEWVQLDWGNIQYKVSKLQSKIYESSLKGDKKSVVKYQKILINSHNAKLLAVRRVTQDNQGKRIAGIDGQTVISNDELIKSAGTLKLDGKSQPLRRVEILSDKGKVGNLEIPTIEDRAKQILAKLALEPEWEAKFEPNSYGWRPGKNCQDAVKAIELQIRRKPKFVCQVDISGCFDKIKHSAILEKCRTFPIMERQIRAWLKSGVMNDGVFHKSDKVTPQGEVISPLLANIALNGMEEHISEKFPTEKTKIGKSEGKIKEICEARLIRYANDFVIFHEEEQVIIKVKEEVEAWLSQRGLTLNPEQTRIGHTLIEYNGEKPGLEFLGFSIRTFKVGKYKSEKKANGEPLLTLTKVKPSEKSIKRFTKRVKEILDQGHDKKPKLMINRLSWLIREWANYFKTGSHSWETFQELQYHLLNKLYLNWGKKRFSKKGLGYISKKIFHPSKTSKYTFGWKENGKTYTVPTLYEFPCTPYVKVQGNRSPYDGDWEYWNERMINHPETPKDIASGLKKQKGKCYLCNMNLTVEDKMEIYYKNGDRKNNRKDNKFVVHSYCRDYHQKMTVSEEILGVA